MGHDKERDRPRAPRPESHAEAFANRSAAIIPLDPEEDMRALAERVLYLFEQEQGLRTFHASDISGGMGALKPHWEAGGDALRLKSPHYFMLSKLNDGGAKAEQFRLDCLTAINDNEARQDALKAMARPPKKRESVPEMEITVFLSGREMAHLKEALKWKPPARPMPPTGGAALG